MIIWFTGMSGAGKTTLAVSLNSSLCKLGYSTHLLDGDEVRKLKKTINDFSKESILENNRLIIEECGRLLGDYDFVLVSVISPFQETRQFARKLLKENYFEVYVRCSQEELIRRDTKGLYRKALNREIDNLIGFSELLPYEEPLNPELVISTDEEGRKESSEKILGNIPPHSLPS